MTLRSYNGYIAISLLAIGLTFILFVHRSLDDNMLTSWQWVLAGIEPACLLWGLLLAVALAFLLSSISLPNWSQGPMFFLCFFALGMFFRSEPEVILDASRYITYSKYIYSFGIGDFIREWGSSIPSWTDLPAVPLLYGLLHLCFGGHRIVFQCLNVVLFSATAVLTYAIGKDLWGKEAGYTAGILMAGFPYAFTQVPLMLVDVPLTFLFTLSVYALVRSYRKGSPTVILITSVIVCAALLSKFSIWPLYSVLAILPATWAGTRRDLRPAVAIALAVALLMGLILLGKLDVMLDQLKLLQSYQWAGLGRWKESLISTLLFQIHPFVTIGACYSVFAAFKRRDIIYIPILWMVCVALALGSNRIRYIMPILPLLALLAAHGMEDLRTFRLRKFAALTAAVSSISLALFCYLPFLQRTSLVNLRDAGEYLNRLNIDRVEVIPVPSERELFDSAVCVPLLGIYVDKNIHYREELYRHRPERDVQRSSLRFTWEYRTPPFYKARSDEPMEEKAVVVISEGNPLPARIAGRLHGYHLAKAFDTHCDPFALKTLVYIYLSDGMNGAAGGILLPAQDRSAD